MSNNYAMSIENIPINIPQLFYGDEIIIYLTKNRRSFLTGTQVSEIRE